MSLLVELIVGELELVEVDDGVHPVCPQGGRVGMHVKPSRRALLLETLDPVGVLVFVAVLVHGRHVHQENVVGRGVEVKQLDFERRKHPPV